MATEVTALRDALKASRLECNAYQLANEKLLDDKETFLERTQQNADAQVKETEDKFEAELLFVKDEADSKAHALGQELDLLRRAASGDACGWTEAEDGTFSNDETGERSAEVPEVLAFARAVQRIEGVAVQENDLKKALKKAAQAGTKWRELDVKLNEAKADAQADRDVLACWGEAAVAISQAVRAVGARNEALCSRLAAPASSLHTYQQKAKRMADKVQSATASFSRLRRAKCAAEAESKRLSIDVARLEAELVATAAEMASLKGDMNARVDAQVVPMRHAVAEARFAMAQERRLRLAERQTLAGLWPAGPKPACLARHVRLGQAQRWLLWKRAESQEAEAQVKREIRHCCAESTKWKEATDDYGRKFYTHHQSGEATWQPPSAMTYEPPPGRDALGNIVAAVEREPEDLCDVSIEAIPADASAVETARREALHAEATWEKVTDDWGQCYWKHKVTSETRWTDPAPAPNPAHSNTVQQLGHSPKNAEHSAEETSAQNSDSSNESPPSAAGGAVYFVRRDERRHARATRRKKAAISAARVVIGYFEELVEERLRRKKAGLLKMDDRDADPPVFGDAQALRELALGARGETWAYVTRASGRESARVAAGQRHLAAVEAQLLLASRRHEVQRTLAQRRKDTGLGQSLKPRLENKGPLADGPDVQTAMPPLETVEARSSRQFGSAVDVNDSAVEVHDSRVEVHDSRVGIVSPTDHGDPYELLLHGCGNAPSARSIAQLRDDLEAAATAEQDLLTELSERRRRIGALSHKLLMATHKPKFVDPPPAARLLDGTGGSGASRVVQVSALSGPAVAPSPAPDAAAPLGAVRSALSTFAAAQATVFEAPGAVHDSLGDGVPQLGGEDGGVIHALACAAVYAGLAGEALRAYVIPHQTDLQWAVSTFFDAPEPWGLGPQSARGPLGVREPLDAPTPARSDARRGGPRRRGIAADDAADEALGADFFIPRPPFNGIASLAMLASATSPELGEALSLVRLRGFPPELGVECLGPATRPGFHRAESKPPSEDAVSTSQGEWLPRRVSELLDLGAANALPEQIALLLAGDSKGEGERPPDLPGKPAPRPVAATQRQSAGEDGPGRVRESFREHAVLLRGLLDSAAQAGTRAWNGHVDDQDALVKRLHLLDGLTHSTNKCWEDASRHRAESDAVRRVRATAGDDAQEERQHRRLVRGVARALRAKDRLDEQVCFCKAEFSLEMERCEWLVSGAQRAMAARAGHAAAAAKQTAELLRLQASLLAITSERARAVAGNALGDASAMETVVAAQLALLDVRAQLFRVGVGIRKARWAEAGFWRADVGRLGGDGASRAERRALLDVEASARLDVASLVGMADACEISRDAGDAALGNDAALGSVDARLAAAYARLASIHEARRLARDRERRGRRQGLGACLTAANCAAHDGAPTAFQHSRLPLSLESTRSTRLCVQMLAESARAEVLARRYDARAAVLAIDHVHSLLVEERRTSRRLCAAALEAGHRALRCSKSVTLKISDDFEGYKTARRKDALREARHRDGLEAGLRAGMEHSAAATHLHADVATSLRFGLSLETAKREVGDATNLALQERVARVKSACRLELGVERGHSARLELWVHALVRGSARVAIEVKHMETLLQRQRQLDLSEQNRLNKAVWRERVAAHTLGLDAGQLCFFFASRCCALAGSSRASNNALRSNGAPLMLAALATSPRKVLRRLGATALAQLGWDGNVDARAMGFQVKLQHDLWVLAASQREESRLRRKRDAARQSDAATECDGGERGPDAARFAPRDAALQRRQWALRSRRAHQGPNRANLKLLASPNGSGPPLIALLVGLRHDSDHDCVVATAFALACASYETAIARSLGSTVGVLECALGLARHASSAVVALACDAVSNLAYRLEENQRFLGQLGGVEALVEVLRRAPDNDVSDAACSALANLLSLHSPNAARLVAAGGFPVLLRCIVAPENVNLLDSDQSAEIQCNAANALANAVAALGDAGCNALVEAVATGDERLDARAVQFAEYARVGQTTDAAARPSPPQMAGVVLLLAAELPAARRAACLLVGNLACHASLRSALGRDGAVDALFASARGSAGAEATTAYWALAQLAWSESANQLLCEKYLPATLESLQSLGDDESSLPHRSAIVSLVANCLHSNDAIRRVVESAPGAIGALVAAATQARPRGEREHALRCLVSLSATDRGVKRLALLRGGETAVGKVDKVDAIAVLIAAANDASAGGSSAAVRRSGVNALLNMCACVNTRCQLRAGGAVAALVALAATPDYQTREAAASALAVLQDRSCMAQLQDATREMLSQGPLGAVGLMALLTAEVDACRVDGANALAEDAVWTEPTMLGELVERGLIQTLIDTLKGCKHASKSDLALSTLAGLTAAAESCAHAAESATMTSTALARALESRSAVHRRVTLSHGVSALVRLAASSVLDPRVLEASLRALEAVAVGDEGNSRVLFAQGLDVLLSVAADAPSPKAKKLAKVLLRALAPLNVQSCALCGAANQGGLTCAACGHGLQQAAKR